MARLKIGEGIQFQAQLPKIEKPEPKEELNFLEIVDNVLAKLPKVEAPKEIDTTQFITRELYDHNNHELIFALEQVENNITRLTGRINQLSEIKHITEVKDVSPEVLSKCKQLVKQVEFATTMEIQELRKQVKDQHMINKFLIGSILLTLLLHLL